MWRDGTAGRTSRRTTAGWIFTSWFSCCMPSLSWLTSAWGCCRNVAWHIYRRTRPLAVERILRRQPRCHTPAQCLRSCHEVHIGIGLIPRNSREGGSLTPIMPLSPPIHISGKFCDNSFCVILQNKQSENITSLAELTSTATFVIFLLVYRQTDTGRQQRPRLHIASCGKNLCFLIFNWF